MELIQYTTEWVKGEVFQGKIMLTIGALLLLAGIMILKSEHEILRGTLIPLGLMVFVFIGYGGMQVLVRPGHVAKVSKLTAENPVLALEKEIQKARKDDRIYRAIKPIWAGIIGASLILFFVFSSPYLKGVSLGLIGLFFSLLLLDTTLHYRLSSYLKVMQEMGPNLP